MMHNAIDTLEEQLIYLKGKIKESRGNIKVYLSRIKRDRELRDDYQLAIKKLKGRNEERI
jgi:formiminotetrahydrofolate cyclodeaminase